MNNKISTTNEYFLFLLPADSRAIKILIDEILDRYEYQDSFIYHEYPDKNELLRILEQIYSAPTFPEANQNSRNLAQTIFLYEMYNRRKRYFDIVNNDSSNTQSNNLYDSIDQLLDEQIQLNII